MKDLHSHLIYGIDDGSVSIEESIKLLKKLEQEGVEEIILTPHYVENSRYVCNNREKKRLLKELQEKAKEEQINIKMYLGNEIYFTSNIKELIKKGEATTLNQGKYVLFEFPMRNYYNGTEEILSKLISNGYIPILAHPERYPRFQEYPDIAEEYLRMGVLFQGNIPSLFGKYGPKEKKLLKYYIKKGWISFLGTDTHHDVSFKKKKLEKMLKRINKDENYIHNILEGNFDRVIRNEEIGMIR